MEVAKVVAKRAKEAKDMGTREMEKEANVGVTTTTITDLRARVLANG